MIDRLQDDTISGLVEVPAMFTKVFQICADYPPDDYLLEGLFFNSIICVGGHGVCMTADTQRYKRMPSYEVHKKLRPGKPENEQWCATTTLIASMRCTIESDTPLIGSTPARKNLCPTT